MGPPPGPARGIAALFAPLASSIYSLGVARRNRDFDRGKGVVELDRPVISVGNLSVGGTGKTPMVRRVVRWLVDAGFDPAIAMRGYAPAGAPSGLRSDEAREHAMALPDVPLVAQPDRLLGLIELFGTSRGRRVDSVVLDDGFQHRRIARQLDVVLIDATRGTFRDRLLPAGWLREPVANLARAHVVVLTHAQGVPPAVLGELRQQAATLCPRSVLCVTEHRWGQLLDHNDQPVSMDLLRAARVMAVCAVGNPAAFLAQVEQAAGGRLAASLVLPDHDPYAPSTLARVREQAQSSRAGLIITTEKDWTKLGRVDARAWPCPIVRPRVELAFREGEETLRQAVVGVVSQGQALRSDSDLHTPGDDEPEHEAEPHEADGDPRPAP